MSYTLKGKPKKFLDIDCRLGAVAVTFESYFS